MSYDYDRMTNEELNELCDKYLLGADGVDKDPAEAAAIARIAADRGDAKAQCNYGSFLLDGTGVEKDEAAALSYWRQSADQGYASALNKVGLCLLIGLCGAEKDPQSAEAYLRKAAEADSMFYLATMYKEGMGVPKNEVLSDQYLVMAGEKKFPLACLILAMRKFAVKNGTGTEPQEGATLLLTAAEGGNSTAMMLYGSCCENGIGVEKDLSEAAGWYRRAAKAGDKQANDALKNLGFPGVM